MPIPRLPPSSGAGLRGSCGGRERRASGGQARELSQARRTSRPITRARSTSALQLEREAAVRRADEGANKRIKEKVARAPEPLSAGAFPPFTGMAERGALKGRNLPANARHCQSVLTIDNARKRFGQVTALDGATFELHQGELLALLGPNGAGKTTLIRAIAGRVRLDGGEIRVFDRALDGRSTPPGARHRSPGSRALSAPDRTREPGGFGSLHGLRGRALATQVDWALEQHRPGRPRRRIRQAVLRAACGAA